MSRRFAPVWPVVLAVLASCGGSVDRAIANRVEIGSPAPAYRTTTLTGDSTSLEQQRGKVVLLNVWATWCKPCRAEIPELLAVRTRYADRGLEIIGVSVDVAGAERDIRDFMKEFQMTYPIWLDPDERISTEFLLVGVPATFVIDRNGVLRWRKTGPVQPGDTTLTAAIERALGG